MDSLNSQLWFLLKQYITPKYEPYTAKTINSEILYETYC
jgi:hypothetical protein